MTKKLSFLDCSVFNSLIVQTIQWWLRHDSVVAARSNYDKRYVCMPSERYLDVDSTFF